MELKPNAGSDRAWVWPVPSDFADEEAKQELLAIRFANSESKQQFFFCPPPQDGQWHSVTLFSHSVSNNFLFIILATVEHTTLI